MAYSKIISQLSEMAQSYNSSIGEDVYKGLQDVVGLVKELENLYAGKYVTGVDAQLKKRIVEELELTINDMNAYFESYPDEKTQDNIVTVKGFLEQFK